MSVLVLALACAPDMASVDDDHTDSDPLVDTLPAVDTDPVVDTDPPDDTALEPWVPSWDCAALPDAPLSITTVPDPVAQEDIAFDADGNLIGGDEWRVYRSPRKGPAELITPQQLSPSGIEVLGTGDIVVNGMWKNEVYRIDGAGAVHTILSGVLSPNGLELGPDGEIYITEWNGAKVRRVDPYTGESEVLADGYSLPNGLTLSLDAQHLYFNTYFGGRIYRLELLPDGSPGAIEELLSGVGSGGLDGMGVDACGNVYVADNAGALFRFAPDGSNLTTILQSADFPLATLQWGSGTGGWSDTAVYFPDWAGRASNGVQEVELGVGGKHQLWAKQPP